MRSPADARLPWERLARAGALVLLAIALVGAVRARRGAGEAVAHLAVDGAPDALRRDSLAALARTGARVSWSGTVAAVAAVAEPVRDPSARTRVSVVSDRALALGDSLGAIDSLPAGGGTLLAAGVRRGLSVRDGRTAAEAAAVTGAATGRVLLLARVGWESKFTIAALEEAGWQVDARLRLADTVRVTQGRTLVPSRGTHAVVVVLDSSGAGDAAAITRFVRAGGGLVLGGEAVALPAFAGIAPARGSRRVGGEADAFDGEEPSHALPLRALSGLRDDAVVLETREDDVVAAARRVGAGRVLQSGLEESWRWRMQAGPDGPRAHREHWNSLVSAAAASAPRESDAAVGAGSAVGALDAAPMAALVERLGPAVAAAPSSTPARAPLPAWLGVLTLILLAAEWASRRARGAA